MKLLAKPFPTFENTRQKLTVALAFGFFVFIFLYFFKPFGLGSFNSQQILLYTLGFGGITFIIMMINFIVLDKIFPLFFREDSWTVGKEILITLIYIALIGLGNYFFATSLSITKPTVNRLLYLEFISLSLAIFPVTIWTLIRENMLLRRNKAEAEKFSPILSLTTETKVKIKGSPKLDLDTELPLIFTSESETTSLRADPEQLYFISSADNYIKVYVLEENIVEAKLLRSSLKKVEETLKDYPQFYRCHRAYVVNLKKVSSVSGNAKGLKLKLENYDEEIPVSRSLNEVIREKLAKIHSR